MPEPDLKTLICKEAVLIRPETEERSEVVRALLNQLVEAGRLTKAQATTGIRQINEREAVGTTAIGGGVALPHGRVRFTDEILVAYALLDQGEGFSALDGAPVNHVFLMLSPKEDDGSHIATLKAITAFAGESIHLNALTSCKTPAEVVGVFKDYA